MKKKLVVLTGAGISAESGIKTFRDMDGLWYDHKVEDVAHIDGWRKNKQLVLDFYNERRKGLSGVEPNDAHKALVRLEDLFDVTVITQNVDDLHERAGSTNVIHLHGELTLMCSSKNKSLTLPYTDDIKVGDKHEDGSQLRPFIVWFGEDVPKMEDAWYAMSQADVVAVIGTSLQVYPAAGLIRAATKTGDLAYIDKDANNLDENVKEYFHIFEGTATEGMKAYEAKLRETYGHTVQS